MLLPADYAAGVVGKIIGVYPGRSLEDWTYVRPA